MTLIPLTATYTCRVLGDQTIPLSMGQVVSDRHFFVRFFALFRFIRSGSLLPRRRQEQRGISCQNCWCNSTIKAVFGVFGVWNANEKCTSIAASAAFNMLCLWRFLRFLLSFSLEVLKCKSFKSSFYLWQLNTSQRKDHHDIVNQGKKKPQRNVLVTVIDAQSSCYVAFELLRPASLITKRTIIDGGKIQLMPVLLEFRKDIHLTTT